MLTHEPTNDRALGQTTGQLRTGPRLPRCVLTKNWVTKHLVLVGRLSKQRVGEGARGIGKASQVRAGSQGVHQWVHGAC